MELPSNKQPIKIIYEYENGEIYFIEGEQLQFFQQNLMASGSFCNIHGFKFIPVDWDLTNL